MKKSNLLEKSTYKYSTKQNNTDKNKKIVTENHVIFILETRSPYFTSHERLTVMLDVIQLYQHRKSS